MLTKIAKCGRSEANVCRNLHRLIHSSGRTFPVEIRVCATPVQVLCGKPGVRTVNYPVLHLSDWARLLLQKGGAMLLGGFTLDQEPQIRRQFQDFWDKFKNVRPELAEIADLSSSDNAPIYVPMALHGDEGRGRLKRPVMIIGHQPIISYRGVDHTNLSGCLPCTDCRLCRSYRGPVLC